jgi:hypothetical protein
MQKILINGAPAETSFPWNLQGIKIHFREFLYGFMHDAQQTPSKAFRDAQSPLLLNLYYTKSCNFIQDSHIELNKFADIERINVQHILIGLKAWLIEPTMFQKLFSTKKP